jgi:Cd2+/Zn2+-exporting ATPase
MGIELELDNKKILVGNDKLMKKNNIDYIQEESFGTIIHLAVDNIYYGNIILEDTVKESSKDIVDKLKKNGIKKTYLLTGDNTKIAQQTANALKIDEVYSELLPNQKTDILKEIKEKENLMVAYVGDGINDGPIIAMADVGISMGNGSDLAVETSDVVILNNDLNKLIDLIKISKRTKKIVTQNIVIILFVKVLFLILSGLGISSMWQAVFADVGISLISILNSLRIYNYRGSKS